MEYVLMKCTSPTLEQEGDRNEELGAQCALYLNQTKTM